MSNKNKKFFRKKLFLFIKKAFTFVEMVVVITIIALISTISFISYTNHLSSSRDATRQSELSDIYTHLESYKIKSKLPIPENDVVLYSSGQLIGYQGYAGNNVLTKIGFQNGGKDPLDDDFYTYFLSRDLRNSGLMGFLENNPTEGKENVYYFGNKALAVDYSIRYPIVYGKKLGILIDKNNAPIQENIQLTGSGIDINTTNTQYKAYFSNKITISGTGSALQVLYGTTTTGIIGSACKDYKLENIPIQLKSGQYLLSTSTGTYQAYCDMTFSGSTRLDNCSGVIPANSTPKTLSTYTQTYDGVNWSPSTISWGENQSSCDFNCNSGFVWNGTSCVGSIITDPYSVCTGLGQIRVASTAYPMCDTNDIIVCSGSGTGYTLSACNVGATIAGTGLSSSTDGSIFQYGRNKAFPIVYTTPYTGTILGTIGLDGANDNYPFIENSSHSNLGWASTNISDNWGDTTNTSLARQGPCSNGYHIPTKTEWQHIISAGGWGGNGTNIGNALKMGFGTSRNQGILSSGLGYYWSSNSDYLYLDPFNYSAVVNASFISPVGYHVRCMKN